MNSLAPGPSVRVGVELQGARGLAVVVRGTEVVGMRTATGNSPTVALVDALQGVDPATQITVGLTTPTQAAPPAATPQIPVPHESRFFVTPPDVLRDLQKATNSYPNITFTTTGVIPFHYFGAGALLHLGYEQVDLVVTTSDTTYYATLEVDGLAKILATLGSGDQVGYKRLELVLRRGGVEDPTGAIALDEWFTQTLQAAQTALNRWQSHGIKTPKTLHIWGLASRAVSLPLLVQDHHLTLGPPPPKLTSALLNIRPADRCLALNAAALALLPNKPPTFTQAAHPKPRRRGERKSAHKPRLKPLAAALAATATLGAAFHFGLQPTLDTAPSLEVNPEVFSQIAQMLPELGNPEVALSKDHVTFTQQIDDPTQGPRVLKQLPFPVSDWTITNYQVTYTTPISALTSPPTTSN